MIAQLKKQVWLYKNSNTTLVKVKLIKKKLKSKKNQDSNTTLVKVKFIDQMSVKIVSEFKYNSC